ncbi:uncharacterized protein LOC116432788 isoform X1 [Nomia melanderi]|uniref:uncharacterized protein LOC116432788 isoform X1 n=2 Tax=Nomia melanderi TaxID=2448451 RepID=UPI003FCDDA31
MSSLDYLDLCRLCLVKDRASVPIFEGEGDERQIFLKIAACLPVKVAREDKLPKKICDDCVYKVESFYHFWNTTANAEKRLLQCLGEVGVDGGKQGYVSNVFNPNVMKQEQSTENRLDGSVMQQVGEHQNNMGMGMMDNMGLGIPMIMSNTNQQQQITSVPMDTSGSSVQNVQAVPGPSSQTTHNQISQNQTSSTQQEDEEESSEDDENSDDECDGDEGLPVKEESEEDPNSRTIEPTTFVNVSLACDEAGPSGLQQQKIAEMPEMPIPQPADGDPKTGMSATADTPNPVQPFVACKEDSTIENDLEEETLIKPPPYSDEEDDKSTDENYENYYNHQTPTSITNSDSFEPRSDEINSDPLDVKVSTQVSNASAINMIRQNSDTAPISMIFVPVMNPQSGQITNFGMPVGMRNDARMNVVKNIPKPVQMPQWTPLQPIMQKPQHNIMQTPQHNIMQTSQHNIMQTPQHNIMQTSQHNIMQTPQHNIMQTPLRPRLRPSLQPIMPKPPPNTAQTPLPTSTQQSRAPVRGLRTVLQFTVHTPTSTQTSLPAPLPAPLQASPQTPLPAPLQTPLQTPPQSVVQTPLQITLPPPLQTTTQTPLRTSLQTIAPKPLQTSTQTPLRTPLQTIAPKPLQTSTQSPLRVPLQTVGRTPLQTSTQTSLQTLPQLLAIMPDQLNKGVQTPLGTPLQTLLQTSLQPPMQMPLQTSSQISTQTSTQTSTQSSLQIPLQTSTQTSLQTSTQTSLQTSTETSLQTPLQTSTQTPLQTSTQTPLRSLPQNAIRMPVRTPLLPIMSNWSHKGIQSMLRPPLLTSVQGSLQPPMQLPLQPSVQTSLRTSLQTSIQTAAQSPQQTPQQTMDSSFFSKDENVETPAQPDVETDPLQLPDEYVACTEENEPIVSTEEEEPLPKSVPVEPEPTKIEKEPEEEELDVTELAWEELLHTCPVCDLEYKTVEQMEAHMRRKHQKKHRCKKCSHTYDSTEAYEKHLKTHEKNKYWECNACHWKYKTRERLIAHQIKMHSNVDPKAINKDKLQEEFVFSIGVGDDVKTSWGCEVLASGKKFPCKRCENVYTRKSFLIAHERIAHGVDPYNNLRCNVCDKVFNYRHQLSRHREVHGEGYLCSVCGKEFISHRSLQLHTTTHTGERRVQCKVCSKYFSTKMSLRVHELIHKGIRPYVCDICGKNFTQRSSMMIHRRKHPGDHPRPPPTSLKNIKAVED